MPGYRLSKEEVSAIKRLVVDVAEKHRSVEAEEFQVDASVIAHELPRALRRFLNEFRLREHGPGYARISGYPVDQAKIGPTPAHWDNKPDVPTTLEEEIYFVLCGALLGDAFGWATQQGGYLMHEVLPIRDHQRKQMGSSSDVVLAWHTEDAFHPHRADYVGLLCLRNPHGTATTVGTPEVRRLSDRDVDILFEPRFAIRADDSHNAKNAGRDAFWQDEDAASRQRAYARRAAADLNPNRVPVLFGRRERPFLCVDPVYMDVADDDRQARQALDALTSVIQRNLTEVPLSPGELLFLDNRRAVHGRLPFQARYDGSDRWLKRINLTADIRKSAAARVGDFQRLIS